MTPAPRQALRDLSQQVVAQRTTTCSLLVEIKSLFSALQDAEIDQRGHIITGQERFLEPFHATVVTMVQHLASLQQLDEKYDQADFGIDTLRAPIDAKLEELAATIETRRTPGRAAALRQPGTGVRMGAAALPGDLPAIRRHEAGD